MKSRFMLNKYFPKFVPKFVEPDRPQMTIWRIRNACWTPNTTNTHSEYVILTAFPLQQWLHERALMFRDSNIACLVLFGTE